MMPAAGIDDGTAGVFNQGDEGFQLFHGNGQHRIVAGEVHFHVEVRSEDGFLHVLGHVNHHRAGTAVEAM